jgi:glycosyltransferase involved in cell wall biosynthesis
MLLVAASRSALAAVPGAPSGGALAPAAEQPIGQRLAEVIRTQLKAEEKAVVRKMQAERLHAAPPRKRKAERAVAKEIEMLATRRGSISIGEPTEPSLSVVSASAPHDAPHDAQSDDVKGNPIYDPAQTMLRRTREDGLNHGYSLAQSAGCQQALAETRAACDSLNCLNATWNALWSKSGQMAYLETGKAASESMEAYMTALFDDVEQVATNLPSGTFAWTFVRDPLERALSAYAETDAVTRRLDGANEHKHAMSADVRYVDVPASVDNGAARFIAYLDDVVANRVPLAWRPQHSRPVADFLRDMPGRLKFVGKLESLERDWPALQKHAKLKSFQRTALPPWIPAAVKPAYDQAKAVPRSDEVLQKVCEVYAADYACFDYERPAACQKHAEEQGQQREVSAYTATHPGLELCEQLQLPAGAHVILVNHDLPEQGKVVNGMYRRMLRMADALSALGVVVHVVLHEWHKDAPSTMPQQRLYKGSMRQQYEKAVEAAGKQLKLGIVFTTAITMRISRDLKNEAQRRRKELNAAIPHHKRAKLSTKGLGSAMLDSPHWNDESLSAVLRSTHFMEQWPEESAMAWNRDQNIPSVVVTDDIHYLRAPAIMEASGQCDTKKGCGSALSEWVQWREIELYASAQMVLTVSTEDGTHIDHQFALRAMPNAKLLSKEDGKPFGQTARGWMDFATYYGNATANATVTENNCTPPVVWLPYVEEVATVSMVRPWADRGKGLFYVGTAHIAGQKAIEWIVSEVQATFKKLGRYCGKGDVGHLYVAGTGWNMTVRMSAQIDLAVRQGRLTFLGVLSDADLEEQMQSFKVFAAPVFNTTGVATKNIFAMARGLPVVTTKDGTQGLGLRCHLCADAVDVEDTAAGFAQRVILLQENEKLWDSKSIRGLQHAELHFTFAAEKSALRTTFGLEAAEKQEEQIVPSIPLLDAFAKPNDRMIELAQDGLHAAKSPACITLADDFKQDGEKALFVDHGIGLQACALETAFERPDASPPDMGDEQLFSCPLTSEKAAQVSEEVRELHRNMLGAGFVRFDQPQLRRLDPAPINMQGGGGHESRRWPRPGMCEHRPEDVLDLQARITRPSLTKMVNWKRRFEYRPMLKAGSTMMRRVLPCLQPGEWQEVQQNRHSPPNMTLLVLQRDPISRFASGVAELMERIFRQQCPEGPCNFERDRFVLKSATASVKKATLWYPLAKQLFSGSADEQDFEPASLRRLVRAAALDASCNLNYYGAEHFASQTGLQLQGEMDAGMQADFFDLDELGESIEQLLKSDFVKTVLGKSKPPSQEDLETCLGTAGMANVQVMLTNMDRERQAHRHTANDISSRTTLADVPELSTMRNMTNHHADVKLPSTAQIVAAVQADPATHLILRAMYAQDFACNDVQRDLRVHALARLEG